MHIHFINKKLKNILLIGIMALSVILSFIPSVVRASGYHQNVTTYDISVTKTWDDDAEPEPVTITMTYSGTFNMRNNKSGSEITFPDSIQIYYGNAACGTAVKSESSSNRTNRQQYSYTVSVPFNFSAARSETVAFIRSNFQFYFDDITLMNSNHFYDSNSGFSIWSDDMVDDLDSIENSTLSETSESGTEYDFTSSKSRSDNTEYIENPTSSRPDTVTTHTIKFTVTNPKKPSGELDLTAKKTLNNEKPDQAYTFYLLDANGNILQTKQNDENGAIQFDPIEYESGDVGNEHIYQVKEMAGSEEDITYDSSVYTVSVTPYQDPDDSSVIIADPTITKDGKEVSAIIFNNTTEVKTETNTSNGNNNQTTAKKTPSKTTSTKKVTKTITKRIKTGYQANPVLWTIVLIAAAAVIVIIVLRKKNKK